MSSKTEGKPEEKNFYSWQKVWLDVGIDSPMEMYLIKQVGDLAWLSKTNRKDMFNSDAKMGIYHKSRFFTDEIEAVKNQVEKLQNLRRNHYDALDRLNGLVTAKSTAIAIREANIESK